MKTEIQKKRDAVISKIMKDEKFLPNLSIKQQVGLINIIAEAKSKKQIDTIIENAKKLKRK